MERILQEAGHVVRNLPAHLAARVAGHRPLNTHPQDSTRSLHGVADFSRDNTVFTLTPSAATFFFSPCKLPHGAGYSSLTYFL
jgi:hypothetical protein